MQTSGGLLLLAFDEPGKSWAVSCAEAVGAASLKEVGAVVLDKERDNLVDTKTPVRLSAAQDEALLQLSEDVRVAFLASALSLDDDDDDF